MLASVRHSAAARPMGFAMPTRDQLITAYKGIADAALNSGKAQALKHAPANAEKYPSYPVSRGVDMSRTVYVIKGELYLKSQMCPMAPHWFKLGPAPMF